MSCGSRKDRTDDTVLELSGQDCLSQLVTPICYSDAIVARVIIEVEFGVLYIVIAHIHCAH